MKADRANRRQILQATIAAAIVGTTGLGGLARPAFAASVAEAEDFVSELVAEVIALVESGLPPEEQGKQFVEIFKRYAEVELIARFCLGRSWRELDAQTQTDFIEAFVAYVAHVYVSLLGQYAGQKITVTGAKDFGKKGILVASIASGDGLADNDVEWRVSDRGGEGLKLLDVVMEGISMLQTQRQEFAAKLEKRSGNVRQLIDDMNAGLVTTRIPQPTEE